MDEKHAILVVDDDVEFLSSVRRTLRREPYTVYTAENGVKALEILKSHPVSLVLSDNMMPEMDGITLLSAIKEKAPTTSVIILTAYGGMDTVIKALRGGAADFLLKPFDPDYLRVTLKRCIQKIEEEQQIKLKNKIVVVCCRCGQVRDDTDVERGKGEWMKLDEFIPKRTNAQVSHSFCPVCFQKESESLNIE